MGYIELGLVAARGRRHSELRIRGGLDVSRCAPAPNPIQAINRLHRRLGSTEFAWISFLASDMDRRRTPYKQSTLFTSVWGPTGTA